MEASRDPRNGPISIVAGRSAAVTQGFRGVLRTRKARLDPPSAWGMLRPGLFVRLRCPQMPSRCGRIWARHSRIDVGEIADPAPRARRGGRPAADIDTLVVDLPWIAQLGAGERRARHGSTCR